MRIGMGLCVAGAAMLGYAWAGERPRMRVQRYRLCLPGGVGAGLRLLHLSDQHFGPDTWVRRRRLRRLAALLPSLKPDLILFTGDFLHNDQGLDAVEAMLRLLPPAPLGCYAVPGNHDYMEYSWRIFFGNAWGSVVGQSSLRQRLWQAATQARSTARLMWQIVRNDRLRFARKPNNTPELLALLQLYGVNMLHNTACPAPGRPALWLAGVDDLLEGQADLGRALAGAPPDAAVILLAHNPDLGYELPAGRAALVLSGHTHGGQVVLPFLGAVHTQGTRLPRGKAAGHFNDLPGGAQMVVSRGMGESTPLRLRCLPEIVVIDLLPVGAA